MFSARSAAAAAILLAFSSASQAPDASADQAPRFDIGEETSAPAGYAGFCKRKPDLCAIDSAVTTLEVMKLTPKKLEQMRAVNAYWNKNVIFETDQTHNGTSEFWDIAVKGKKADCEDVVRAKLEHLRTIFGFPRAAMMQTVVYDTKNRGHLVVAINTDQGLKILDNLTNDVLNWQEAALTFTKVQGIGGKWYMVRTFKPEPRIAGIIKNWGSTQITPAENRSDAGQGSGRFADSRLRAAGMVLRGTFAP